MLVDSAVAFLLLFLAHERSMHDTNSLPWVLAWVRGCKAVYPCQEQHLVPSFTSLDGVFTQGIIRRRVTCSLADCKIENLHYLYSFRTSYKIGYQPIRSTPVAPHFSFDFILFYFTFHFSHLVPAESHVKAH